MKIDFRNFYSRIPLGCQGFSVMELMAVIFIMSVLMSAVIPNFRLMIKRGENQEAEQILRAIWLAETDYKMDNGIFATNVSDLDIDIGTPKSFVLYPQQQNITCFGGSTVNTLAHLHKLDPDGGFLYEIILIDDGRVQCYPCGLDCEKMGYERF